jgi:Group II intron, maturase-specific domain/Reverse transcriptase (RNA-dependent DNA polymerase)
VLVRFADDLLVMCQTRAEAEAALASLRQILGELGLQLKDAKTRIVHLKEAGEGVDFLGFHHQWVRATRARHVQFLARWPSREAMQRAGDRIRELTDRKRTLLPVEEVVRDLNNFLRGWANYYRYGNSRLHFTKIRTYALERMVLFMAKRYDRPSRFGWTVVNYHSRNQLGLISLDQLVVTPALFGTGGSSGADRMPAVKNVGEACAREPHARCARDMTSSSGVRVPCGG